VNPSTLHADYVIVGAGAVGMAFADTLLSSSPATMIIVDRRAQPGGHWSDGYPFLRLHAPSMLYGVNSMMLGSDRIETRGLNRGLHELASASEIVDYFERVMNERLLPSGRVQYLRLHDLGPDGMATSLTTGQRTQLQASRRWVDTTRADTQVPATHAPHFELAAGVHWVTPSGLTQLKGHLGGYVIVGGGKTAMDTALCLLEQGVAPDRITWIRPREAWLLNRANVQPTTAFAERTLHAWCGELEAARDAESIDDLFDRLEAQRLLLRIDPQVKPSMYRCAIVSEAELAALRSIRRVVRLGRVRSIGPDRIVLEHGEIATTPQHVHVHCSSRGLPRGGVQAPFQGQWIVPQYVRRCAPSFSAAFVAHVEASFHNDVEKNALCEPVVVPEVPLDWLRIHVQAARNQSRWARYPLLRDWMMQSRLEAYSKVFALASRDPSPAWLDAQRRLSEARAPAMQRLWQLLEEAEDAAVALA
jgi:hypothetical protein